MRVLMGTRYFLAVHQGVNEIDSNLQDVISAFRTFLVTATFRYALVAQIGVVGNQRKIPIIVHYHEVILECNCSNKAIGR